ncbi:Carboxynorspermidine decarboxylase, putative [Helicobacter typhlonius]|uniref:Carboxynorspermidine/carboxyspermidine decarboxylase n=2 Tax=Helicobacter typhlonius TaxID=76936 RepID=A0A099UCE1_9HELI|nr:carboxynorspermidine decarboxylase [Helicobacter typhlonius]TLD78336.1 carboxynorspermidine decarboxylase [Helicobacter typhlonius]CUU39191.1 Carboxynorspermidine decarboxylase, putative [Helicobacter typhlonius]HCD73131.1 carboxynorspermidine decarboxylase [Helicobacter sp.]
MRDISTLLTLPSPCYVLEEERLNNNLAILESVQKQSGAKILLALKGYAFWRVFENLRKTLNGSTASGLYEARLGFEEIGGAAQGKEVCVFSPAYKEQEMLHIIEYATHIIFNSFAQWQTFKPLIESKNQQLKIQNLAPIEVGLRVNPLYSEVEPPIYNPCIAGSRLGITPSAFQKGVAQYGLEDVSGLHFHTHCEQDSTALKRTLPHFEKHFGAYIRSMKWINFGGGHHITRADYHRDLLVLLIKDFKARHNDVEVFLEPGEAVGWQVGFLIGEVVDIVENGMPIAILDVSASCHMPDCLEMPYRPALTKLSSANGLESDKGEGVGAYKYRLGGPTCLAGDVIGDYSFDTPLCIGDRVIFEDMLHYTIVKNTTFNGVGLPSLGVIDTQGVWRLLKSFDYNDYKQRN